MTTTASRSRDLAFFRMDDDRPLDPLLLLNIGMRVIPVGPGLPDLLETVGEGFLRFDRWGVHIRHAVHIGREEDPMPVNRDLLIGNAIAQDDLRVVALGEFKSRRGQTAVHEQSEVNGLLAAEVHAPFRRLQFIANCFCKLGKVCRKKTERNRARAGSDCNILILKILIVFWNDQEIIIPLVLIRVVISGQTVTEFSKAV